MLCRLKVAIFDSDNSGEASADPFSPPSIRRNETVESWVGCAWQDKTRKNLRRAHLPPHPPHRRVYHLLTCAHLSLTLASPPAHPRRVGLSRRGAPPLLGTCVSSLHPPWSRRRTCNHGPKRPDMALALRWTLEQAKLALSPSLSLFLSLSLPLPLSLPFPLSHTHLLLNQSP